MVHNTIYPIKIEKSVDLFPISVTVELPEGSFATKYFQLFYADYDAFFSEWEPQIPGATWIRNVR